LGPGVFTADLSRGRGTCVGGAHAPSQRTDGTTPSGRSGVILADIAGTTMSDTLPLPRILGVGEERGPARLVADVLGADYQLHWVSAGSAALAEAPDVWPDTVLLDTVLPDMSASELCRRLLADGRIKINTPVVICGSQAPGQEERVIAIKAGARGFLGPWLPPDALRAECAAYVQAKRETDRGLPEALVDTRTGLYSRRGLVRRMREIGAQAIRLHEPLSCLVLEVSVDRGEGAEATERPSIGWLRGMQNAARQSDVTGRVGPGTLAVIAPGTDAAGAVRLAERLTEALRHLAIRDGIAGDVQIHVGYEAVSNLAYAPIEPVAMLLRAATALRNGRPEPKRAWVRRFQPAMPSR
jgi:PleD family two-component response regulator